MISFLQKNLFLIFMLTGSLLSGCISTSTQGTKFYVLNPLKSDANILSEMDNKKSLSVEVASVRLPQYLEKPQIVTRSGENQLELAEFHQWGGNLRKNMMRVLAKNLSQILGTPNIAISPHRPPGHSDFRVELEVMQFERHPDSKVRLTVQWRLSEGRKQKNLTTKIAELESPAVNADPGFNSTVSAMSALMGELSQIISEEILNRYNGSRNP